MLIVSVPLQPHGSEIDLTIDNVEEYVSLSVKALLEDGVNVQLDAFRQGFEEVQHLLMSPSLMPAGTHSITMHQVFTLKSLRIFSLHELKALVCGLQDDSENWLPHGILFLCF